MGFDIDLGKVGITNGGIWNTATTYEKLTIVQYGGQSYISKKSSKGVEPGTDATVWQLVASKGADGSGGSGGGGGTSEIGVAYFLDGLLYWTINGEWLRDSEGNMVRAQGVDGKDGAAGADGKDGDGISSFKSIVFVRSEEQPAAPTGGSFINPVPTGWYDGVPAGERKLWMSTRWFYSDDAKTATTSWTTPSQATDTADVDFEYSSIISPGNPSNNPSYWHNEGTENDIWMAVRTKHNGEWGGWSIMKIKGENGTNGVDGKDGTSITILGALEDSSLLPATGNTIGDTYIIDGQLWVWDGDSWENCGQLKGDPGQGQYIHVAYSDDGGVTLTAENGTTPGKYIGIVVTNTNERPLTASSYTWSKFAGDDGFGYEYIYMLTADATAPNVPIGQNVDEHVPSGWSDDPLDVSAEYPYCWMCSRKKVSGVWSAWAGSATNAGKAALFAKYGRDGVNGQDGRDGADGVSPNTSFKSIVFKRSNSEPETPTGGSYASPVPSGWSDGVPSGSEQLWMSTRMFSSDGETPQQAEWTEPVAVTDTEYMDYEFSSVEENPGTPAKATPTSNNTNPNWSNTATENTIWMAMRKVVNGEYSGSWNVVRIKGEPGADGTSITIKGTLADASSLPSGGNTAGDAYLINGHLYVWDGDSWEDAGQIQGPAGEDGQTPYLHIRYSNDGGQTFTANNGATPGSYIGMYWDYNSADSNQVADYAPWRQWKGADGFGYEYIFKLTASSSAPAVPSANSQADDYVPSGWTDNPGGVNASTPYCWVCYRKKTNGAWGNWVGSSSNPGYAGLYSHYGADGASGRGIQSVTEMYAAGTSAVNPPSSWGIVVPDLTATNKYLWNYEIITFTDGDSITTTPCVVGTYGTGRGIVSIVEHYLASASSSGITKNASGWTTTIQTITSAKPYLWNYETITYDDGTTSETDPIVLGHFGANGSDGLPGVGISSVTEHYLASAASTGVTKNTAGWTTSIQQMTTAKPYLWNYETINYSDGNSVDTQPCIIGVKGSDGSNGRGISSVVEHYLATSLTTVTRNTAGWTTTPQTISTAKPYLWNYETINFDDGTSQNTDPVIIGIFGVSSQDDMSFLSNVFGADNVSGESGALLRNLLGVTDSSNKVVAMLNGSTVGQDSSYGRLFIAAGLNGVSTQAGINAAKFKVWENGRVELGNLYAYNANIAGTITAVSGTIGPFTIGASYGALTASVAAEEFRGTLELAAGYLHYSVLGNGYGGEVIIGYRSSSDGAMITARATQEDPAIRVSGEQAIRVESGQVLIADGAYISLDDGAYIDGYWGGEYKWFRTPIERQSSSIGMHYGTHTFIPWGSGITYTLPAQPKDGDEFDIITTYYSATLALNGKAALQIYGGTLTEHSSGTITLAAKYHYRMWYDGTCWIITRN